jgi:hypothetical protein
MGPQRIGAVLALMAMVIPVAGQAADLVIGTVASGTSALLSRDGKVIPAVPGMRLYSGDRLLTRAGGAANVRMANNCAVTIGASSMLPMTGTCAKPSAISFDEGRAGYAGSSSAFEHHNGIPLVVIAFFAAFAGALYYILHNPHNHHPPVSP